MYLAQGRGVLNIPLTKRLPALANAMPCRSTPQCAMRAVRSALATLPCGTARYRQQRL